MPDQYPPLPSVPNTNIPDQHPPLPSVQNTDNPVGNDATSHHHSSLDHSDKYERLNHSQLKALCKTQGYRCDGNRDRIIQRLRGHDTRRANTQTQPPRGLPSSAVSLSIRTCKCRQRSYTLQTGDGPTQARVSLIAVSDTALLVCGAVVFFALFGQLGWLLLKDYLLYENVITILEWRRTLFWYIPLVLGVTLAVGKFFLFG